jgi:hypothetical protein
MFLEPAAKAIVLVPRDRNGQSEAGYIAPAAGDFVRQAQRFNVEIDFAIE